MDGCATNDTKVTSQVKTVVSRPSLQLDLVEKDKPSHIKESIIKHIEEDKHEVELVEEDELEEGDEVLS